MAPRKSSGLEQLPRIFSRPLWKDAFFWLLVGMLVAWAVFLRWLIF